MLRTPVEKLKIINEKEDLEFKMLLTNKNNELKGSKKNLFERDHLPFAHLKKRLAHALSNAPKRPNFLLAISQE